MTTTLMAFDPSAHGAAWAFFVGCRLTHCGLDHVKGNPLQALARFPVVLPQTVVIEVPQIYQQRHWKGDPNDLIDVALAAGMLAATYRDAKQRLVRPHAWKGNAPKDVMGRRIMLSLDASERDLIEQVQPKHLRHNVVDAAGLGLWALGRLR